MPQGKDKKTHGILAMAGLEPYQEKQGEEYMNDAQRSHFRRILEEWRRQLRQEVDRTVHHMKIEEDDFGFCESCGIEIGIRRLEARPTADQCVDCKTLAEMKEKQMTGA